MSHKPGTIVIDDPDVVGRIQTNPLYIYRSENAWSLRIMAAKCGVTQTTVSKWEDGTSYPTDDNMAKIAEVIKTDSKLLAARWREWYQLNNAAKDTNHDNEKETNKAA